MAEKGSAAIQSLMEMCETAASTTDVSAAWTDVPECLISLVDGGIRDVEPGEYVPGKVHIGPFHYGCRSRDPYPFMEKQKMELFHGLLPVVKQERQHTLERYLTEMAAVESRARRCYDHTFSTMSEDDFAWMLLLDGCYLLSRFVPITARGLPPEDIAVVRDVVFLLQNQIPFFVLEKIHRLITGGALDDESIVLRSVADYVEKLVWSNRYSINKLELEPAAAARQRPCHLLHLLYMYFRPTQARDAVAIRVPVDDGNTHASINGNGNGNGAHGRSTALAPARWCAATDYRVAGVRLVKRELDGARARSVLDVELTGGTLQIPCLMVDNNTLTILRNMVALEQKSPLGSPQHVTAYCLFMSQLASREEDVALLFAKEIVVHFLSSHATLAAELGKLCNGVVLDMNDPGFNYLRPVQEGLERLSWPRWRKGEAWLRHTKCSNPWMVLGVGAAILVFVCGLLQGVFAVLSYVKGKNT